jgi:hypothetical protein
MFILMLFFWPISFPLIAAYSYVIYWLFKKRVHAWAVAVLLLPFILYKGYEYYWFTKVIPEKIGITYAVSIEEESALREGCGTVVFKVSDSTLEAIKKEGIHFFAEARQGRGLLG